MKAKGTRLEVVAAWLRGISDGESYVSKPKTANGTHCSRCIMISNTDPDIIAEIERSLEILGIEYRTRSRLMVNKKPISIVMISNQTNLVKWRDLVGFVSGSKLNRLNTLINDYKSLRLVQNPEKQRAAEKLRSQGKTFEQIGKELGFSEHTISRYFGKKELRAYESI